MKALKWIAIVIIGLIILGLFLPDSDKADALKTDRPIRELPEEPISEAPKEDIEVIKMSETVNSRMRTVHVEVKNNTKKLLTTGQIKLIYENKSGDIVGTGTGTILNLASGASRVVDCLAMDIEGADTYRVEVLPLLYQ